jgi:hypothetical protein
MATINFRINEQAVTILTSNSILGLEVRILIAKQIKLNKSIKKIELQSENKNKPHDSEGYKKHGKLALKFDKFIFDV